jgi:nitrate/nitrite transport system permease protein
MAAPVKSYKERFGPYLLSLLLLVGFLFVWEGLTSTAKFNPAGKTEDELMMLEFNGDIVKNSAGQYIFNPDKPKGIPRPAKVLDKAKNELAAPFHKKGTNDHGIGWLIIYTVKRFLVGFVAGSIVAILVGLVIGLNKTLFTALNPFIQFLKPISPLAWMPLMLYTIKDGNLSVILVVFMACLWPTIANTAFGVNSIRKDYLHVSALLEMSYLRQLFTVVLPAAAPAIIAGLRISFGSALVAVIPAEMLTGELGVGYLSWIEWNNLDISGLIFAILVVGVIGFLLDYGFGKLSARFTYSEV